MYNLEMSLYYMVKLKNILKQLHWEGAMRIWDYCDGLCHDQRTVPVIQLVLILLGSLSDNLSFPPQSKVSTWVN